MLSRLPGQKPLKRVPRTRVADHDRRSHFSAIHHPYADSCRIFKQDFCGFRIDHNFATSPFNDWSNRFRYSAGPSDRIASAFEIMVGNERVQTETTREVKRR